MPSGVARFAFEKVKLIRVEIVIAVGNVASVRVAQKLGAHDEGVALNRMTIGEKVCDAHMFSLLPSDFDLPLTNTFQLIGNKKTA